MYRDVVSTLDEHDSAVGAILIAESLIAGCERAEQALRAPQPEPWLAVGDAQFFPEVWRHLDRARRELGKRGINTATYEDLRPSAPSVVVSAKRDGSPQIDRGAIDIARRALESLKVAVAGTDWAAIEKRTAGLVNEPQLKRRNYTFVGAVAGAFILASLAWTSAVAPRKKPSKREVMRNELADIAAARKDKIAALGTKLGDQCHPALAHDYVAELVLDGRADDARTFGDSYVARCGEDEAVTRWAHAPKVQPRAARRRR